MRLIDAEQAALEALEVLPEKFRDCIRNLAVIIEDEPDEAVSAELGCDLLGLLDGPDLAEQTLNIPFCLPTRLIIYRRVCEAEAADSGLPEAQVIRETVWHELAHYFGQDESGAERLERKWDDAWRDRFGKGELD